MIYISRRETFAVSHRIFNPALSDEENETLYGKCANKNGHGHNYALEVVVKGEIDPKTGYVLDLKDLKRVMKERVVDRLDHKNLNLDVDFLRDTIPTSENIAVAVWRELKDALPSGELHSIKLYETEKNYVEYRGE
jgi:6-pyruvoyltetrahydropterin/6-carboxytetrahydropterin synthase